MTGDSFLLGLRGYSWDLASEIVALSFCLPGVVGNYKGSYSGFGNSGSYYLTKDFDFWGSSFIFVVVLEDSFIVFTWTGCSTIYVSFNGALNS